MKSKVHPTYKTIWSDRLAIVPSECVSARQGGRRHRYRRLPRAVSELQTQGADRAQTDRCRPRRRASDDDIVAVSVHPLAWRETVTVMHVFG